MSDVIESAPAQSRQPRPGLVIGIVALLLAASFWSALNYWRTPLAANTEPACASASGGSAPRQVTVNVFNATDRRGLAAATAQLVREHGFAVAAVKNDQGASPVPQSAVVRYGADGEAGAQQVLALVPGAVPVLDSRDDASVDLVLGDGYTGLASLAPTAAPAGSPC